MAGGGGGGGGSIASAYVEIGGDLSGLRAAEQEAKEIFARIQSMGGGGSIAGGGASGGISQSEHHGGGAAAMVADVTIQIRSDEATKSQIDGFFRSYQVPRLRFPSELVATGQVGGRQSQSWHIAASMPTIGHLPNSISSVAESHGVNTYGVIGETNGVADLTRSPRCSGQNPGRPGTIIRRPNLR